MTTISTDETEALLEDDTPFVDLRTVEEFDDGHVPGALNLPFLLSAEQGLQPNKDFLKVMEALFKKQDKFIIGCKSGGRSAKALALLTQAGYSQLLDMAAGFVGKKDAFGQTIPGWLAEGREVETDGADAQSYAALKKSAGL